MSLYTINPLETAPISHTECCFAKKSISHSVQTLLPVSLLKRHRISQRTVTTDFVRLDQTKEDPISAAVWSRGYILESET